MRDALRVLVIGVVMGATVVFDPRRGHHGGRPKQVLVVAGAAAALGLLTAMSVRGDRRWLRNPLRWPLLALVGWTALAAVLSPDRDTAVFGYPGSYHGLVTIAAFAVLYVAAAAASRPGEVAGTLRAICLGAGAVVLLFGVGQLLDRLVSPDSGWDWARPAIAPRTIGSTLGNPNHLAGLLAMLLPLAIVLAVQARGPRRALIVAGIALAVAELAITVSRGGWLAVVTGSAVLAVLFRHELRPFRSRVLVAAAAAAVLMVVVLVVLGALGVTKIHPSALARAGPGTTIDQRVEIWRGAWRMAADRPLFGVGPDAFPLEFPAYASERFTLVFGPFTVANGAHNLFLNTLAELGVVGLLAFAAVLVAAGRRVVGAWPRVPPDERLVLGGIVAALVAYLVQGCLNTQTIPLTLLFWVLLGLAIAVTCGVAEER